MMTTTTSQPTSADSFQDDFARALSQENLNVSVLQNEALWEHLALASGGEALLVESYINQILDAYGERNLTKPNRKTLRDALSRARDRVLRRAGESTERCAVQIHDGVYVRVRRTRHGDDIEPISNFILRPIEWLEMPDEGDVFRVRVELQDGSTLEKDLPAHAFNQNTRFLDRLSSGAVAWLGNDKDLQRVRQLLSEEECPRLRGVSKLGRHEIDGQEYIVLPGITLSRNGPEADAPIRFADHLGNPIAEALTQHGLRSLVWPDASEHREAAAAIYSFLPQINDAAVVVPITAWTFALPWSRRIQKTLDWGGFPILNISGTTGAGKTTMARLLLRLAGFPPQTELTGFRSSSFILQKLMSASNLHPAAFDEFRLGGSDRRAAQDVARVEEELRLAYNGARADRGTSDQRTIGYDRTAPILVAGEGRPADLAVVNRSILVEPEKKARNPAAFESLQKAPLDAFSLPYLVWALGQDDWLEALESARGETRAWLDKIGLQDLDSRVVDNLAVLRFGWAMYERYAASLGLRPASLINGTVDYALSTVVRAEKRRSNIDDFLELVHAYVDAGRLTPGEHFLLKGRELMLHTRALDLKVRELARSTGDETQLLSKTALARQFKEAAKDGDSYVVTADRHVDFPLPAGRGRNQKRCVVIDVDRLETQMDLPADVWESASATPSMPKVLPIRGAA